MRVPAAIARFVASTLAVALGLGTGIAVAESGVVASLTGRSIDVSQAAPSPTSTTTSSSEPTTTTTVDTQPAVGPSGETPTTEYRNHGQYVSEVAHETPPGPEHGAAVSDAARSDVGKADHGVDSPGENPVHPDSSGDGSESAPGSDG